MFLLRGYAELHRTFVCASPWLWIQPPAVTNAAESRQQVSHPGRQTEGNKPRERERERESETERDQATIVQSRLEPNSESVSRAWYVLFVVPAFGPSIKLIPSAAL